MGLNFRISNTPSFFVRSIGDEEWTAIEAHDWRALGEEPEYILSDYNFRLNQLGIDNAEGVELRALPPEGGFLSYDEDPAWAYSGFSRFRKMIAKSEGIDLDMMWGFRPMSATLVAEMRGISVEPLPREAMNDWATWEAEQYGWWDANAIHWENVDTVLTPFLHHSDCEGDMEVDELKQVVDRLEEICRSWPDGDHPMAMDYRSDRERGLKLVAMMRFCIEHDRKLVFC